MNEENEIIYGEEPVIYVIEVKHLYSGIYKLRFSNGITKLFDITKLKGEVFEPLQDPEVYKNPRLEFGVVTWNNGEIDCDPEFMFSNGFDYNTENIISV